MVALSHSTDLRSGTAAGPGASRIGAAAHVVVYDTLAAAEPVWRAFEATAHATPYQRFDWIRAFADTIGRAGGSTILVAMAHDGSGAPSIIIPLTINRTRGLTHAEMVGGKQANYHMPLFAGDCLAGLDPSAVRDLLLRIAAASGGVDAFAFTNQPTHWQGVANPFARLAGKQSPSNGYKLELDFDCARTVERILSGESRKKLRKKEKRLAEFGPLSYQRAKSPTDVEAVLSAFFAQKAMRFHGTGIDNPFAEPAGIAFVRQACLTGIEGGATAIELYCLKAGDKIIATFSGCADSRRFCGMFNSFDMTPEIARWSPGDLLLIELIRAQCQRGLQTFDLGVGEARYKSTFCDGVEDLVDTYLPITVKGAAFAAVVGGARAAKGWVKRTPWAWRLAQFVRARAPRS